jgi:hypothetical protein
MFMLGDMVNYLLFCDIRYPFGRPTPGYPHPSQNSTFHLKALQDAENPLRTLLRFPPSPQWSHGHQAPTNQRFQSSSRNAQSQWDSTLYTVRTHRRGRGRGNNLGFWFSNHVGSVFPAGSWRCSRCASYVLMCSPICSQQLHTLSCIFARNSTL